RGRQRELVIDARLVHRRTTELDHLEPGRALEHAMTDPRRLQHAITGLQHERLAPIFVDDAHPTAPAVDQLAGDLRPVHVVGHDPSLAEAGLRRAEPTTTAIGHEIAVAHARASELPLAAATDPCARIDRCERA